MQRFIPGQKLRRLPGGSLNRALDLVEKQGQFGPPPGPGDRPPTFDTPVLIVPCKNTSGVALPERAIVGVDVSAFTAPDITPGSPDANDADAAILRGVPVEIKKPDATTHASKWGVTLGPLGTTAPHNVGHMVIAGLVWARVNVTDAAHQCVTIETDDYTYLKSAASGMAIWDRKLAGTGKQWALVLLGGGGGDTIEYPPKLVLIDQSVTGVHSAQPEVHYTAADITPDSIHSGTAQAGASSTITLAAGADATDDYYNGATVTTTGGTGSGQTKPITDYVGATKVATVGSAWSVTPDNTTTYDITYTVVFQEPPDADYDLNHVDYLNKWNYRRKKVALKYFASDPIEHSGTAEAGSSTSIELEHTASTIDDFYVGSTIETTGGTGSGQTKTITAYDAATFTATVDSAWSTTPDNTTSYEITSDVYSKLALTTVNDTAGKRAIVRYATTDVYFDDDFEVGEYDRENYPSYPENEIFPPDGTGTYQECPVGFLTKKYRGLVVKNVVCTAFCTLLPPPDLIPV